MKLSLAVAALCFVAPTSGFHFYYGSPHGAVSWPPLNLSQSGTTIGYIFDTDPSWLGSGDVGLAESPGRTLHYLRSDGTFGNITLATSSYSHVDVGTVSGLGGAPVSKTHYSIAFGPDGTVYVLDTSAATSDGSSMKGTFTVRSFMPPSLTTTVVTSVTIASGVSLSVGITTPTLHYLNGELFLAAAWSDSTGSDTDSFYITLLPESSGTISFTDSFFVPVGMADPPAGGYSLVAADHTTSTLFGLLSTGLQHQPVRVWRADPRCTRQDGERTSGVVITDTTFTASRDFLERITAQWGEPSVATSAAASSLGKAGVGVCTIPATYCDATTGADAPGYSVTEDGREVGTCDVAPSGLCGRVTVQCARGYIKASGTAGSEVCEEGAFSTDAWNGAGGRSLVCIPVPAEIAHLVDGDAETQDTYDVLRYTLYTMSTFATQAQVVAWLKTGGAGGSSSRFQRTFGFSPDGSFCVDCPNGVPAGCAVSDGMVCSDCFSCNAAVDAGAASGTSTRHVSQKRQVSSGSVVVACPTGSAAEQLQCLELAVCRGLLLSGGRCFVNGAETACPACSPELAAQEAKSCENKSSSKGLLGLLGLLAIIPLVLCMALVCLIILCCMRSRQRRDKELRTGTLMALPGTLHALDRVPPMEGTVLPEVMTFRANAAPSACVPSLIPAGHGVPPTAHPSHATVMLA
eukprot:TRINITY_DN67956_c0_g1_i1.p1 TRINITY_DN67956_c0_g1~~TRINITY_DN67956_c0_g1_i1.p1  ORF type:complete len:689 (+),score=132.65 TRINITY_DN67956_c0_g1_i1:209-2275(+)